MIALVSRSRLISAIDSFYSLLSNYIRWRVLLCIYNVEVGSVNACAPTRMTEMHTYRTRWILQCQKENVCAAITHVRSRKKNNVSARCADSYVATRTSDADLNAVKWNMNHAGSNHGDTIKIQFLQFSLLHIFFYLILFFFLAFVFENFAWRMLKINKLCKIIAIEFISLLRRKTQTNEQ